LHPLTDVRHIEAHETSDLHRRDPSLLDHPAHITLVNDEKLSEGLDIDELRELQLNNIHFGLSHHYLLEKQR
jgi:hypothetical protein